MFGMQSTLNVGIYRDNFVIIYIKLIDSVRSKFEPKFHHEQSELASKINCGLSLNNLICGCKELLYFNNSNY